MKIALPAAALAVVGITAVCCSGPSSSSTPTSGAPDVKSAFANGNGSGSAGGQMEVQASPEDKAKLDKMDAEYTAAKASLAKAPNDPKAKEHFSSIGALYGHECMMTDVLDRKVKYALALKIYREVLKVDPNNPVAKQESDMIVSIYKSMKRPIPE